MNEPLHLKYRPRQFTDIFQPHIVKALKNAIANDRVPPTTIFCGWSGVGKTTVARIYAMAMNCENRTEDMEPCLKCKSCKSIMNNASMDVTEINASSKTGINDVREEIEHTVNLSPMPGPYHIYILDEAHKLSSSAQNALLKLLEEPPAHARFILCTTEVESIITTIQNRAHIYNFRRASQDDIIENLKTICGNEGWTYEDEALEMIALASQGSPRNSVKMLDQLCTDEIKTEDVETILGVSLRGLSLDILGYAVNGKVAELLRIVDTINSEGKDLTLVLSQLCNDFEDIIRLKCGLSIEAAPEALAKLEEYSQNISKSALVSAAKTLVDLQKSIVYRNISQDLVLEAGLIELASVLKKG